MGRLERSSTLPEYFSPQIDLFSNLWVICQISFYKVLIEINFTWLKHLARMTHGENRDWISIFTHTAPSQNLSVSFNITNIFKTLVCLSAPVIGKTSFFVSQLNLLSAFISHMSSVMKNSPPLYESFATVGEIRVWWRADFQSGSRVLKKVFWILSYLYLWHTMWFHAKKLLKTLKF